MLENKEITYQISINLKCSIFTGEMIAIEKTLDLLHGKDIDKNILLLTDSKSTCKSLLNNKMSALREVS